jgi:hypothetical protein
MLLAIGLLILSSVLRLMPDFWCLQCLEKPVLAKAASYIRSVVERATTVQAEKREKMGK